MTGAITIPTNIEATVQEVNGRRVAAIGIEDGPSEKVVLIVELKEGGSAAEATDRVSSVKRDVARAVMGEPQGGDRRFVGRVTRIDPDHHEREGPPVVVCELYRKRRLQATDVAT